MCTRVCVYKVKNMFKKLIILVASKSGHWLLGDRSGGEIFIVYLFSPQI